MHIVLIASNRTSLELKHRYDAIVETATPNLLIEPVWN